ncbi:hypothetical protein H7B90_06420 [Cohnella xylanilytica]|uniref:Uncharacterized protein n=1 Tax=Cohnella xylanilytica TaxID=557555 RepID=A0A841TS92_9BACL|nr:hypothetical protein [Cohnella xylanilytica]MBB6691035.1 hypothetical protein [Cohnella xylanilytica]
MDKGGIWAAPPQLRGLFNEVIPFVFHLLYKAAHTDALIIHMNDFRVGKRHEAMNAAVNICLILAEPLGQLTELQELDCGNSLFVMDPSYLDTNVTFHISPLLRG